MKEDIVVRTIRTLRSSKGFTLLEALFAISILAIGLLAVITMIDASFAAGSLSKNTTRATELASWMVDRIKQDTSLTTQIYTIDGTKLLTYDNDSSTSIVVDTNLAADPANEPGRTAVRQWRALIQGLAVPSTSNYMGANTLRGERLPAGRGTVTITPNDLNKAGNHTVIVQVIWQTPGGALARGVTIESILAASE